MLLIKFIFVIVNYKSVYCEIDYIMGLCNQFVFKKYLMNYDVFNMILNL